MTWHRDFPQCMRSHKNLLVHQAPSKNGRNHRLVVEAFASVRRGAVAMKPGSDDPPIVYVPVAYHCCFQ